MPSEPRKYTDEECENMIKAMSYPVGAPSWVIKAIRKKRRELDRNIKSPKKEMEDFIKELGGTKIIQ